MPNLAEHDARCTVFVLHFRCMLRDESIPSARDRREHAALAAVNRIVVCERDVLID